MSKPGTSGGDRAGPSSPEYVAEPGRCVTSGRSRWAEVIADQRNATPGPPASRLYAAEVAVLHPLTIRDIDELPDPWTQSQELAATWVEHCGPDTLEAAARHPRLPSAAQARTVLALTVYVIVTAQDHPVSEVPVAKIRTVLTKHITPATLTGWWTEGLTRRGHDLDDPRDPVARALRWSAEWQDNDSLISGAGVPDAAPSTCAAADGPRVALAVLDVVQPRDRHRFVDLHHRHLDEAAADLVSGLWTPNEVDLAVAAHLIMSIYDEPVEPIAGRVGQVSDLAAVTSLPWLVGMSGVFSFLVRRLDRMLHDEGFAAYWGLTEISAEAAVSLLARDLTMIEEVVDL